MSIIFYSLLVFYIRGVISAVRDDQEIYIYLKTLE